MKANETKFQELVASNYQYVVPLFQRPYSWTRREWQQLWDDVKDLIQTPGEHFIGSIVNIPTPSVPAGVSKFLLIDGQQRMTTLFLLMLALRDKARLEGDEALADEINDMVVNRHKKGDDHYKLMPTQVDRAAFKALVSGQPAEVIPESSIHSCFKYFRQQITQASLRDIFDVISNRLSIVSIVLDKDDNPHVVFESLNAKGRSLSQADLIRNYFFMRIHVDHHEEINAQYWQPMQDALGENTTEFIRHFLMKDGGNVRQPDVYQVLKKKVETETPSDILAFLKELAKFSRYYSRMLFPQKFEADPALRRRMERLNTLQATVAYPFLLNVYYEAETEDQSPGKRITPEQQFDILYLLENYIFRRAICGVPTSEMNKMFPALYGWVNAHDGSDFVIALRQELQKRRYPRDDEFRDSLIRDPLYAKGDRAIRARFLLETLEESFGHKEVVDLSNCTIEHVLPQTLDHWWQERLGERSIEVQETWLHTLGNLTLTAYNTELSNDPFPLKRGRYLDSHLQLNRHLADYEDWGEDAILHRATVLADQALKIWFDFRLTPPSGASETKVEGTKPYSLTIMGQSYPVRSWVDVLRQTVGAIHDLSPEKMESLRDAFPYYVSNDRFRRSETLSNGMYLNKNWNADTIYRTCRRMIDFIGIDENEWQVSWE